MYRFRFDQQNVDSRYVAAYLQSPVAQSQINDMKTGISDSGLNLTHDRFKRLRVPLAPRAEQERIVDALEKTMSHLDAATISLEQARRRLRYMRASVLQAAITGRLVGPHANFGPAMHRSQRFADRWSVPQDWEWLPLSTIVSDSLIGLVRARSAQRTVGTGSPYIKMNNVTMEGSVEFNELVLVDVTAAELERFSVKDGDLLFNTRNSSELVGKTGLVVQPPDNTVFNNNLMRIRFGPRADPRFMCLQMCSPAFRRRLDAVKNATTNVAAIYARALMSIEVALPPRSEQVLIVSAAESAMSAIAQLEIAIERAVRREQKMRQSVLNLAFEGGLSEQDSGAEPASRLVEHIAAQRSGSLVLRPNRRSSM